MDGQPSLNAKRPGALAGHLTLFSLGWLGVLALVGHACYAQTQPTDGATQAQPSRQQLSYHQHKLANLLEDVERRYGETAAALHRLRLKLEQTERELAALEQDAKLLQKTIGAQQKILAAEVRAAFQMGRQQRLKLLLNQNDPVLSGRMLRYYQYFLQQRLDRIRKTETLLAELDGKNQQAARQHAELATLWSEKKKEQDALARAKAERGKLLAQFAGLSAAEQLLQLQQSEAVLAGVLAASLKANASAADAVAKDAGDSLPEAAAPPSVRFSDLKGSLPLPTQGRIVQTFGSPRLETVWDGVLIAAQEGAEVKAVADGKVVFAQWLKSYGYLMILEHDPDYLTLYAFNQSLFKRKNDTVRSGEVIAAVGQSGGRPQPGLYFAIRKQGAALDPAPWWQK